MNKKIFKYPLLITGKQKLELPANAEPLSAQVQNGQLCIWFIVDTHMPPRDAEIYIYGTGNNLPEFIGNYISTVQMEGLVWHIFTN
jgi:hypothetical protein